MDMEFDQADRDAERLASQRVAGEGRIVVKPGHRHGSALDTLYQRGAAKIRLPDRPDGALEAVLINTAGGMTGGDRLAWSADLAPGTRLTLTTQACEKVYRAASGEARTTVSLKAAEGAAVAWLPQETIVFDRSAFSRRLDVTLAAGAEALLVEATLFGRAAMGETVRHALFRDRWRVSMEGRLVHAEELKVGPDVQSAFAQAAVTGGAQAVATVLLVGHRGDRLLEPARAVLGPMDGISHWTVGGTGKLLARLVAADGYALRRRLVPLLSLLNGQAGLPRIWSS